MVTRVDPRDACIARGQWHNITHVHFYEFPTEDPDYLEVWCYTDRLSYAPGETVRFHTSSTAKEYSIEVVRDGASPKVVYRIDGLPGEMHRTPKDAFANGCGWPVAHEWTLPGDLRSGGYIVYSRARSGSGEEREQQHFFAVRPADPGRDAKILLVCATSTWIAYNEWGGSNSYWGVPDAIPDQEPGSAVAASKLSIKRPWSRGFIWAPAGAPRNPVSRKPEPGAVPRYEMIEYAYAYGLSKYYTAAGWALYERLFVEWAEKNGYAVDVITQHDLHFEPEILQQYPCVALVGHDEYWSWEMRDSLESYIDAGGHVARFGSNYVWQVRFEDNGDTQVCYKIPDADPLFETDQQHLLTTAWECPLVNRPGAETLGLNGISSGVYSHWSAFTPRSSGGYTVYRPEHWVFQGTDLYFGDVMGSEATIVGYELDGVTFTFRNGLPYPTYEDGAPESLEILAMAPTKFEEEDHGNKGTLLFDGPGSWHEISRLLFGEDATKEQMDSIKHGAGMMGVFTRGNGEVFNAGTAEWVNGLKQRDFSTEQITRNVLDRYTRE